MNLVVDERVGLAIVRGLRRDGHEVLYVAEESPSTPDDVVLGQANGSEAVLITADRILGELLFRQCPAHGGVVLLRLAGLPEPAKVDIVVGVFRDRARELVGAFSVVSPGSLRIRRRHT